MSAPAFFFAPGNDTGHSVCLTAWAGGILLPRKEGPTAFNLVLGASGLASETIAVSGTVLGFAGATEDVSGRAWVVDYMGDVTLVTTTGQQVFGLPTAASGDVFVGAALCNGHPYFVASDGDIFTFANNAITQVSPGFGAHVSSISSDGSKLYATLPPSNLATYTFSTQTAGAVSTSATPLKTATYVAAGAISISGGFVGSQNTGGTNPVIAGPVSGTISEGSLVSVLSVTIADTVQAASGLCSAVFSSVSGAITVTGSRAIVGNGTGSVSVSDSFAAVQTCAASLLYNAPTSVGHDSISVHVTDSLTNTHTLVIPVTVVAQESLSAVALGGWTDSSIVSGAAWFDMNQAATAVVATNTHSNSILLLTGAEPDWEITQAVSGTGAPTSAVWASTGEQVLAADPTNGKVQVFNLVNGALQAGQVITLAGATNIAVSASQLTAFVTQPGSNSLSVLTNNVNTWSVTQTITLSSASSCVVLSPLEIAVGVNGGVAFLQNNGATWSVTTTITGLGYTPVSLATDGRGNVFATGGTATGHITLLNIAGVTASATWTGSGNAVFYEQGQLAVADSVSALVRIFPALGTSITQQNSVSAPSGCVFIGHTNPSVWICGASGIAQDVYTAPFRLVAQKAGAVSVLLNGSFVTAQLEVGHQPSAGAWNTDGVFWSATLQNDLDQISTSGVVLNDDLLSPESVSADGLVPSLGISSMLWFEGALWAASSLNESLMLLAGIPPAGTIIAPGPPIGLSATNVTATSLILNWVAPFVGTFPEYQVQFRVTGAAAFTLIGGLTSATSTVITGLQPLTSYDFQVIATNSAGSATSAPPFPVSTTNQSVSTPTGLVLSAATGTTLTASWTASNGTPPISYTVQFRVTGSGASFAVFGQKTGNTSVVITGLAPATQYDVQVIASNAAGTSAPSATATNSTIGTAPSAPGAPVVQSITATSAALTWTPSGTGAGTIEYQPQFALQVSGIFNSFGSPIPTTNVVVSGLIANTTYEFRVIASNQFGQSTSPVTSGVVTALSTSTWDPNNESGMLLTASNLTATTGVNIEAGVRSTTSKNTGTVYVELTANTAIEYEAFGFANSGWVVSDPNGLGGPDNNSIGVILDGDTFLDNNQIFMGPSWQPGDVLGVAINFTHREFWYRVNAGTWLGSTTADPTVSGTGISFSAMNAGPYFMAFSGTLIGSISGTQTTGTSQPMLSGPARAIAILNRDAEDIPFSSTTSFWTVGIGSGATWGATTDTDVTHLRSVSGVVNSTSFGQPIYFGTSNDPLVTITCTDTALPVPPQTLHIPRTATPAGPVTGGNHNMSFYDSSQPGLMWSYSGCTLNNGVDVTGGITAQLGAVWDTTGDGYNNNVSPNTDYNFAIGTITDYDLRQGVIRHALRCMLGPADLHSPGSTFSQNIPYPNTHEDLAGPTIYTGSITYGSTIGIPAVTNLSALGLTQGGLLLANALQTYGMTIRGSGKNNQCAFNTTPESASNPLITEMIGDLPKIMPLLNIMRNQSTGPSVGTINGGGTYPTPLAPVNGDGGAGTVQLLITAVSDTNENGGTTTPTSVIPANAVIGHMHPAGTLAAWAPGNFTAGQRCSSAGNAYQCVSPGTSTSAPTGTGSSINNGGQAVFTFLSSIDFTTVQAFFNSLANQNLTAPQALMIWNDGPISVLNSAQWINDFNLNITTSPSNPIIITTAPGESFKGKNVPAIFNTANGVSVVTPSSGTGPGGGWVLLTTPNVIIDGIQFHDPNPTSGMIFFNLGGSGSRIQHFIIDAASQANFAEMFYLHAPNINVTDFVIVDRKVDGSGVFTLKYDVPTGTGNLANGVVYAPNGVSAQASAAFCTLLSTPGSMNVINVAFFGFGVPILSQNANGAATVSHSATDQASFQPSSFTVTDLGGNLVSQTLTSIFNSTSDFREKSGAPTIHAGIVDTTDIPTADDLFGRLRGTQWDIGPYQFNVVGNNTCTLTMTCGAGVIFLPASGTVSGNFTDSVIMVDTFANCASAFNEAFYNASDALGQDTIKVTFVDSIGLSNTLTIPVTIQATNPASKTINFGISPFGFPVPVGYPGWDSTAGSAPAAPTGLMETARTSSSVSLSWTASASGTPTIFYQPQFRLTGQTSWISFGTPSTATVAAITGLNVNTSYDFQIIAQNGSGQTTSASPATVTVVTATTVPSDPTGTPAHRIADMMERFGVNTFSTTSVAADVWGAAPSDYTTPSVIAALKFITGNSGLTMNCRELHFAGAEAWQVTWCPTVQAATGARFSMSLKGGATDSDVASMVGLATGSATGTGWMQFMEGAYEPAGFALTPAVVQQIQQDVFTGAQSTNPNPFPVTAVGPSFFADFPDPETQVSPGFFTSAQLSAIRPFENLSNIHFFFSTEPDLDDGSGRGGYLNDINQGFNSTFGNVSQTITEWNPVLFIDNDPNRAAYYTPCFFLSAFRLNYTAWYWYSLFDFGTSFQSGLFPQSNANSPRPVAFTLQAMYQLTGDPSAASKHTFGPGMINYSVSGLPAALPNAPNSGGQTLLFQNSAGTYFLYVWNVQANPGGTAVPVTINFNSHAMTNVKDYNLTDSASMATMTPVQNLNSVSSVTVQLDASVHLLVITY